MVKASETDSSCTQSAVYRERIYGKRTFRKGKRLYYTFLLVRDRSTRRCYEIPDCEMLEFRAVCDPNYKGTLYVDTVTAEARPGQAVQVIAWPVCRT